MDAVSERFIDFFPFVLLKEGGNAAHYCRHSVCVYSRDCSMLVIFDVKRTLSLWDLAAYI